MATLTGNAINTSYEGLLKTTDNAAISGTAKGITDGAGNAINMEIKTNQINFPSGTVDFTGATVVGVGGGGAAGLEAGSGANSMQSAASLTGTPANASGGQSISIGDASVASSTQSTSVGKGCEATGLESQAYGNDSDAVNSNDTSIGRSCVAQGGSSTAIGANSTASGGASVAIGNSANSTAYGAIALGDGITAAYSDTLSIKLLEIQNYLNINFADDTAAAAGGVPFGGVYHTSGALKIRIS
jgi:hypothetical protein